jgi:hypothetical protein
MLSVVAMTKGMPNNKPPQTNSFSVLKICRDLKRSRIYLSAALLVLAQEQVIFDLQFHQVLLQFVMLCNCWSS